jgi:GGDEF domain-containing protein
MSRGAVSAEPDVALSPLEDIAASTEESLVLYDLARALNGHLDLKHAGDIVAKHVRRVIPASTCVFYIYDPLTDELEAEHASGEGAGHFAGIRIPRGQRLSGWVAANKQTIVNSEPVLDLGEVARIMKPRPRSCLSTPLVADGELVGVLTLYTSDKEAFSENHRRVIEVVARQASNAIKQSLTLRYAPDPRREEPHALPGAQQLDRVLASAVSRVDSRSPLSLIFIRIEPSRSVKSILSQTLAPDIIAGVVEAIQNALRSVDVLFQQQTSEFVVLLTNTDFNAAAIVADRIASGVAERQGGSRSPADSGVQVTLSVATAPDDGRNLSDMATAALSRTRLGPFPVRTVSPSIH